MNANLDIDILRTFHAVVRSGKFRDAAEQLHKSPAAISVHIQRLEAVAGGRLLDRDNHSVCLTALGRRLLISTADLLSTHDRVLSELHGTRLAGRIRLGVPDEHATHIIRDILPPFAEAWPNVVLEVTTSPSQALRDLIARGKLHAALVVTPKSQPIDKAHVLAATTPVWVGSATRTCDWADPLPLAVYAAECPYREAMLTSLKRDGRTWRFVLDSPSGHAVKACVEAGLAITLLDRVRVTEGMRILETLPSVPEHEIVFVKSTTPSSEIDEAVELLAQAVYQNFRL